MSDHLSVTIGANLKRLREASGKTQLEIAHITRIPQPHLSQFENDHRLPSVVQLVVLADCFECTTDAILGRIQF